MMFYEEQADDDQPWLNSARSHMHAGRVVRYVCGIRKLSG